MDDVTAVIRVEFGGVVSSRSARSARERARSNGQAHDSSGKMLVCPTVHWTRQSNDASVLRCRGRSRTLNLSIRSEYVPACRAASGETTMKRFWLVVAAAFIAAIVVAYNVGRARANGIPTTTTVAFRGSLLTFGQPDNNTHSIGLTLYLTDGTPTTCVVGPSSIQVANGQFALPLTSNCVTIIHQNAGLDLQVTIDGTAMGMMPITAVPYAVEADTASNVASGSPLSLTLANFVDLASNQTIGGVKTFTQNVTLGTTSTPASLNVTGTAHAAQFGTVFPSSACVNAAWNASCQTTTPGTGTVAAGSYISFDINTLSLGEYGNVGLLTVFFGLDPSQTGTTDNSWVVAINAHGGVYNQFSTLASRSAAGYGISFGSITTFTNTSALPARYVIREVPLLFNTAVTNAQ